MPSNAGTWESCLGVVANVAAILTAIVAVLFYAQYQWTRRDKLKRLERHLKAEKAKGADKGQRTILHLVANLSMPESDVLDAAFRSKHVRCVTDSDAKGRVALLLFEYSG